MKPNLRNLFMKKTDSEAGRANHLRQYFLTNIHTDRVPFLSKICEQKKEPSQALLAGIK